MKTRRADRRSALLPCLVVLGLFPAFVARGEDEIDGPAGELPKGDDMEDDGFDVGAPEDEPAPAPTRGMDAPIPATAEEDQVAWDSYGDDKGAAAVEITKGVRVEDIIEPPSDYRYAAFGKGDPFVPPLVTEELKKASPLEIPIVSPLQRYRLEQLGLVGIWQLSTGERKAMIMAPPEAGGVGPQGIIVKTGDPIGNRGGRILGIGDDYMTVREFSLAPDGTRQYEDHQMFMGRRTLEDVEGKIRFAPGAREPQVIIENQEGVKRADAQPAGRQAAGDAVQLLDAMIRAEGGEGLGNVAGGAAAKAAAAPQPKAAAAPAAAPAEPPAAKPAAPAPAEQDPPKRRVF